MSFMEKMRKMGAYFMPIIFPVAMVACDGKNSGASDDGLETGRVYMEKIHKTDVTITTTYYDSCGGGEPETEVQSSFSIAYLQKGEKQYGIMLTERLSDNNAKLGYALLPSGTTEDSTSQPFENEVSAEAGQPVSFPEARELDPHKIRLENLVQDSVSCVPEPEAGIGCAEDGITSVYEDGCFRAQWTVLDTEAYVSLLINP